MFVWVSILVVILTLILQRRWKRYVGTLEGKTLFITGCDTGIGRLMALEYCEQGAHVLAACLTEEAASALSAEAKGSGTLTTLILDVTDTKSIQDAFAFVKVELEKKGKSLYALINNAGIYLGWLVEMSDNEEFKKVMDVNFHGCVMVTKAFLPLIQQPGGRIVSIASAYSLLGVAMMAAPYVCSKFAQNAFLDILRRELIWSGIKVVKILPGVHSTSMVTDPKRISAMYERFQKSADNIKCRYRPSLPKEFEAIQKHVYKITRDPIEVVPKVQDALLLKNPPTRMLAGYDAHVVVWPLSFLPESWADCILYYLQRIQGAN